MRCRVIPEIAGWEAVRLPQRLYYEGWRWMLRSISGANQRTRETDANGEWRREVLRTVHRTQTRGPECIASMLTRITDVRPARRAILSSSTFGRIENKASNLTLVKIVKMLGTEIDDIFSGKTSTKVKSKVVPNGAEGKSKSKILKPGETQTTTTRDGEGKKRKKKKKEGNKGTILSSKKVEEEEAGASGDENENEKEAKMPSPLPMKNPKKRPRDDVEEVVDPSITVKKPRLEKNSRDIKSKGGLVKVKKGDGTKGDLERFKDSRGASGRRFFSSLAIGQA